MEGELRVGGRSPTGLRSVQVLDAVVLVMAKVVVDGWPEVAVVSVAAVPGEDAQPGTAKAAAAITTPSVSSTLFMVQTLSGRSPCKSP
jgi:hypothetical protein